MAEDSLGPVPKTTPHLMADFLELCICCGWYDEISISDAISITVNGLPDAEDIGDADEDAFVQISSSEPNYDNSIDSSAEISDKQRRIAEEWFAHIRYRLKAFSNNYPFVIESGNILRVKEKIEDRHFLYFFLLVCSRLKAVPNNGDRQRLASQFEQLSAFVLKSLLPENSVVRIFGKGSTDRQHYYGHNARKAICKLAEELNDPACNHHIENIHVDSTGDEGLDVIGYTPWLDGAPGRFIYFGQCASRMETWPEKVLESHPVNWSQYITFTHQPANVVFIPVCFRKLDGNWVEENKVYQAVVVDRLRVCQSLGNDIPISIVKASPELMRFIKIPT